MNKSKITFDKGESTNLVMKTLEILQIVLNIKVFIS